MKRGLLANPIDGSDPAGGLAAARPARRPSRVRRTQAERTEATRIKLLEAARKVIKRRGYLGFTTAEAAELAGVSRGAPNHHFGTSDAFLVAALEHMFAISLSTSRRRASDPTVIPAAIDAIIEDARGTYFSSDFYALLDVVISASKKERTRAKLRGFGDRLRRPIEEMWRDKLVELGSDPVVAEDVVLLLHNVCRGAAIRALVTDDFDRVARTITFARELALAKLAGVTGSSPKRGAKRAGDRSRAAALRR